MPKVRHFLPTLKKTPKNRVTKVPGPLFWRNFRFVYERRKDWPHFFKTPKKWSQNMKRSPKIDFSWAFVLETPFLTHFLTLFSQNYKNHRIRRPIISPPEFTRKKQGQKTAKTAKKCSFFDHPIYPISIAINSKYGLKSEPKTMNFSTPILPLFSQNSAISGYVLRPKSDQKWLKNTIFYPLFDPFFTYLPTHPKYSPTPLQITPKYDPRSDLLKRGTQKWSKNGTLTPYLSKSLVIYAPNDL